VVLLVLAAAVGPMPLPRAARGESLDQGTFQISVGGRAMGTEQFFYDVYGDSAVVQSGVRELVRTPSGAEDTLKKSCLLSVNAFDLDLRYYSSNQLVHGMSLKRELGMQDTLIAASSEINGHGLTTILAKPLGRIYVHDPELYVLFDVISRNLHTQTFDSRPINLLVLGPTDTTIEVTATRLPPAPYRWGAKNLQADRLKLDDGVNQITIWSDSKGRMLRLEKPGAGLVVTRVPQSVKPAKKPTPH
jgi:hypothetical protein